jgi:tripartite-type tricarboxylate transporter receptor subunit TctC
MLGIDGILAPAKTPAPVIKRLNQEIRRFLETPEARERFFGTGVEATGSTPEEFAAKIKADVARMGKLIKEAGITGKQ